MANYDPPTENLPIFDKDVFNNDDTALTIGYANKHYLKICINGSSKINEKFLEDFITPLDI